MRRLPFITVPMNRRERDAVLAGLRALQGLKAGAMSAGQKEAILAIANDSGEGLTPTKIDNLCLRLNFGDENL